MFVCKYVSTFACSTKSDFNGFVWGEGERSSRSTTPDQGFRIIRRRIIVVIMISTNIKCVHMQSVGAKFSGT